jgi:hypothetical protein
MSDALSAGKFGELQGLFDRSLQEQALDQFREIPGRRRMGTSVVDGRWRTEFLLYLSPAMLTNLEPDGELDVIQVRSSISAAVSHYSFSSPFILAPAHGCGHPWRLRWGALHTRISMGSRRRIYPDVSA